jgi:hypothetical protein
MTAALDKDTQKHKVNELKVKAQKKLSIPSKPPISHLLGISHKKGQKKLLISNKKKVLPIKKAPIKKVVKPVVAKSAIKKTSVKNSLA